MEELFNSVFIVQRKKERKSKQKEGIKFLKKNKEKKIENEKEEKSKKKVVCE